MTRATIFQTMLVLLAVTALPHASQAQSDELAGVRMLLLAHHDVPSQSALARAADDPVSALEALAVDGDENSLIRRRALFLLSSYNDARVEPLLVAMLAAPQGILRRTAARGLSRRLTASAPERLVPLLATLLRSAEPDDRETAVILLGQTPTTQARQALTSHRMVERHRTVVAALRRVLAGPLPGEQ